MKGQHITVATVFLHFIPKSFGYMITPGNDRAIASRLPQAVVEYRPVLKREFIMSLDINQIALHQLIKRDEQNLSWSCATIELEPTTTVVEMVAESKISGSIAPRMRVWSV